MMRRSLFLALGLLLAGSLGEAAGPAGATTSPSPRHCAAVRAFTKPELEFRYGVVQDTELLLAPQRAANAGEARRTAESRAEAVYWARWEGAERAGVALLRDAGFSKRELDALTKHEFVDTTGSSGADSSVGEDLGGNVGARLGNAPAEFARALEKRLAGNASSSLGDTLHRVGVECGLGHDSPIKCEDLLSDSEVAQVIGGLQRATFTSECLWEAPAGTTGSKQLVVGIYRTPETYDWFSSIRAYAPLEAVAGVGDRATWTNRSPIGTVCSEVRTMLVEARGKTMVIGVCQGKVPESDLMSLAEKAASRLS